MLKSQLHGATWWTDNDFPSDCHGESAPEAIAWTPILLLQFSIGRKQVVTQGAKYRNANIANLLKFLAALMSSPFISRRFYNTLETV